MAEMQGYDRCRDCTERQRLQRRYRWQCLCLEECMEVNNRQSITESEETEMSSSHHSKMRTLEQVERLWCWLQRKKAPVSSFNA